MSEKMPSKITALNLSSAICISQEKEFEICIFAKLTLVQKLQRQCKHSCASELLRNNTWHLSLVVTLDLHMYSIILNSKLMQQSIGPKKKGRKNLKVFGPSRCQRTYYRFCIPVSCIFVKHKLCSYLTFILSA